MSTPAGDGHIGDATITVNANTDPALLALRGFSRDAQGHIRDVRGRFVADGTVITRSLTTAAGGGDRFSSSLRGLTSIAGSAASVLGRVSLGAGAIGVAAGGAVPLVAGLVAAVESIAPAAAVGVSALLTVQIAAGALKLGMLGVQEAISAAFDPGTSAEDLAAAMKALSPEARLFVTELRSMKGTFTALQLDVQNRLFRDLDKVLETTAKAVLPSLERGLASAMAPANLKEFIEAGPRAIEGAQKAMEHLTTRAGDKLGLKGEALIFSGDSVKVHSPLPSQATRIAMAGGNYADHALGMLRRRTPDMTEAQAIAETRKTGIWGFWKLATNVIGPDETLTYPSKTQRLDYEAEVVVVLNQRAKDVPESRMKDYIWGYTLQNDWSLRDQPEAGNYKFVTAKNFDGSSSLGPCIVVGEIGDPENVPFELHINGDLRQRGNTKDMIFSFGEFLEYLTRDNTFNAGDMISGGTCAGTAADSSPRETDGSISGKLFCHPGDLVQISSPLIGMLRNKVVAK